MLVIILGNTIWWRFRFLCFASYVFIMIRARILDLAKQSVFVHYQYFFYKQSAQFYSNGRVVDGSFYSWVIHISVGWNSVIFLLQRLFQCILDLDLVPRSHQLFKGRYISHTIWPLLIAWTTTEYIISHTYNISALYLRDSTLKCICIKDRSASCNDSSRSHAYCCSSHVRQFDTYNEQRVVNVWNSLPKHAVEAETLGVFKTRLDTVLDTF